MTRTTFAGFPLLIVAACTSLPSEMVSSGPGSATPEVSSPIAATPEPTAIGSDVTGAYEMVLTRPGDTSSPLPVVVVDHTGLVVGIAAFPPAEEQPTPKDNEVHGIVSAAPGDEGIVYTWSANCASRTVIDIRPGRPGGLTLEAVTTPSTEGCLLAVVFHFLVIKTSTPIPLDAIELR